MLITSRTNPLIKKVTQLHHAKYRKEHGLFIAEGVRTCVTILQSNITCTHLLYTNLLPEELRSFAATCKTVEVAPSVMEKVSIAKTPSGILGIFVIPDTRPTQPLQAPGLVCADIATPGNLGTLLRTAAAVGIKTVVTIDGCDPWSPKVVQSSAGTIGMIHVVTCSWSEFIAHKGDATITALVVKDGKPVQQASLSKSFLVVGNEAYGINPAWIGECTDLITLPMPGGTESLNAAVAGSIALYIGQLK